MAYSQHEWVNGEIITAEKLNNMEAGIADNDTREIAASATATVDNSAGEPSCEVAATGSVSSIDFKFAFKGIKGEQGEQGEKGADGVAPLLQKGENALQVSYDGGSQWQDLVQIDELKGEKGDTGETGEKGADAPTITACEINIAGAVITGKLTFSDSSSVDITGTYTAESGAEEEDGGNNNSGDNGASSGNSDGESVEAETEGGAETGSE